MAFELTKQFFHTLNIEDIDYCHWKGNYALEQVLSAEKDIDLLVDRRCLGQVTAILASLGCKLAVVKGEPGTARYACHYFGNDALSGQLIHVHLYSDLLDGEEFINSHLLPFGGMLLEQTRLIDCVKVPAKAAELVSFVLRLFIRYGSPLDLLYVLREAEKIDAELHWLLDGTDLSDAFSLLNRYCPSIDRELFVACLNALTTPSSLAKRIALARQVRRRLRAYSVYSSFGRLVAYTRVLWGYAQRRLRGNKKTRSLWSGGAVIAVVGPDATGKSTLVTECSRWLGSAFAVKRVHAGLPPISWLTAPVNVFMPFIRALLPRLRTTYLEGNSVSTEPAQTQPKVEGLAALVYALRAVSVAWDRRQLLLRARRSSANGEIVICDRYPSETIGAMDSPRLREDVARGGMVQAIFNRLARIERQLYAQIPPPDTVLRLHVSVETAKVRNRARIKDDKESDAYLEIRHRQSPEWRRSGTRRVYDIDTSQLLLDTVLTAKRAIWESL